MLFQSSKMAVWWN